MFKLIINLKAYKESTGENAINIAKIAKDLEKKAKEKNIDLIICPEILDLRQTIKTKVKIYTQHIDNFNYGAHTGFIIPQAIKEAGAKGSLINHSEHRISKDTIKEDIKILRELKLESCVCARDKMEVKEIAKLKPDFIAVEPPELIGGDISISTAKPQLIIDSLKEAKGIPLLVGAGVKNTQDVKTAIELGAKGILVASGVVKAKNIKKAILELMDGF